MKEVKCEHCHFWTDGDKADCHYCGRRLREEEHREREERAAQEFRTMPFVKIKPDDHFVRKGFKYVILFLQLIISSVVSFIAALASGTVH